MTPRPPIPDDVHRFVLTSVASVPFLEAVLLLRADPNVSWNAAELARRLFVTATRGDELLTQLHQSGLSEPGSAPGTWRWNAGSASAPKVDRLAAVYAVNVVDVTELIHSRQERRALQFADAFRLKRQEK